MDTENRHREQDRAGRVLLSNIGSDRIDPSATLHLLFFALETAVDLGLRQRAFHACTALRLLLDDHPNLQTCTSGEEQQLAG